MLADEVGIKNKIKQAWAEMCQAHIKLWPDLARLGISWIGMGMVWYDFGMVWLGLIWFGLVCV